MLCPGPLFTAAGLPGPEMDEITLRPVSESLCPVSSGFQFKRAEKAIWEFLLPGRGSIMIRICGGGQISHLLMNIFSLGWDWIKVQVSHLAQGQQGPETEASLLLSGALQPSPRKAASGPDQCLWRKAVFGQACNLRSPLGAFSLSYLCWAAKIFT